MDHKDPPHFWGQIQAYDCQGPAQIDTDERVIRPDQFIKGSIISARESVIFGISEMCSGPGRNDSSH